METKRVFKRILAMFDSSPHRNITSNLREAGWNIFADAVWTRLCNESTEKFNVESMIGILNGTGAKVIVVDEKQFAEWMLM